MNPQFRDIVQNHLTTAIKPNTRTDGGYARDTPPPSLDVFMERINGDIASMRANKWELDFIEQINLLDMASRIYSFALADWIRIPLSGDAPAEVVAWQAAARSGSAG